MLPVDEGVDIADTVAAGLDTAASEAPAGAFLAASWDAMSCSMQLSCSALKVVLLSSASHIRQAAT